MKYRFAFDMGATSIGWAVFEIENGRLVDFGVRIFDDGRESKSKAALCVKRRNARGARRLVNRKHIMTKELIKTLLAMGLFPKDQEERKKLKLLNPYELRCKALDEKLEPVHLGRALFQLSKRKGFKSNRKDDKEEGGKLKKGFQQLLDEMESKEARTYGEYLYKKHLECHNADLRLKNTFNDAGKFLGGLFPFREIYQNEFNAIWNKQSQFYPQILTPENKKIIENIIFFQRPLREQEEGWCQFEKDERRLPKAHPLFQEFRIWQHVLNLEFCDATSAQYKLLEKEKSEQLIHILKNPIHQKVTKQGIIAYSNLKKELGLERNGLFNFEKMNNSDESLEKGMLVDRTQNAINQSNYFKDFWNNFNDEQKGELINTLARPQNYIEFPKTKMSIEDENDMIAAYLSDRFGLSSEAVSEVLYEIDLEDGFASLSEKAVRKILPAMKSGMRYAEACLEAGYHHSVKEFVRLDKLPYYGEILEQSCLGKKDNPQNEEEKYGRINNATVHVALNQVRHLVNELIDLYGKPFDLSIEYARDLNASAEERSRMTDVQAKNELENQRILKEMNDKIGIRAYNKRDIEKYKIWKQMGIPKGATALDRECPFSGVKIGVADLLNGEMFQIEHLIPFSRSLDDSLDNKVLATVKANRYKANRTPFEAFGESKDDYNWKEILGRAKKLSYEQQWRFRPDAMKKFEEKAGPIARSLNDTRYMTRLLQAYLQPIVREDGKQTVQSVAGKLTAMVRKSWGLNQYKNKDNEEDYRAYHNHHAIDAIVIAAIDRAQIAEVANKLKQVSATVIEEFKNEFYKLKDESIAKEEKAELRKRIKDFTIAREEAIINQYVKLPKSFNVKEILDRADSINISHKPSLKNIKQPNSTIGKLHEDTAYGLDGFVDETGLKARFICKGESKDIEITDYIPMFYHKEDKKNYYDAYKDWFVINGKARTMKASNKSEKELKKEIEQKEKQAIAKLRAAAQKAFKWFVGGGNFCAEIYQIHPQNKLAGVATNDRNDWKSEIISNYNATIRQSRGDNIFYWQYKYPNAKRIMRLRRNDMAMATFSREQAFDEAFPKGIQEYVRGKFINNSSYDHIDVLFRVKKISTSGTICLTPHNIAKEDGDTKSWASSAQSLQKYQARKVFVTFSGRIQNAK